MSVEHQPRQVNGPRAYDSSRRREQSRQTHNALLDAAQARFIEQGYTATTIESISADAEVSAATIYKSYGGKSGVVRALCERALGGVGPVRAEQRSDALQTSEANARKVIEGWGKLSTEVAPRIVPLLLLLRDAAEGDPTAAALYAELDAGRHDRMRQNARYLVDGGHSRPGIRLSEATDVLWTYSSPELFDLLVRRRHWSLRRYSQFIVQAITNALL